MRTDLQERRKVDRRGATVGIGVSNETVFVSVAAKGK